MNIQIKYSTRIVDSDIEKLSTLSEKYAVVELIQKSSGNGAIDLVSFVEISFGTYFIKLIAKPILESYMKGIINEDFFQNLGSKHRKKMLNKSSKLIPYLNDLYAHFIIDKKNLQESISIVEHFENFSLFVSLNEEKMTEDLLSKFPEALCKTYSIITLGLLELEDPNCVQLYPNFDQETWDYLFIPTSAGFGKYIDKYYSFKDNKIHFISSASEFIERFNITDLLEYKLLINPRN